VNFASLPNGLTSNFQPFFTPYVPFFVKYPLYVHIPSLLLLLLLPPPPPPPLPTPPPPPNRAYTIVESEM
jgi:hypothetical protein